MINVKVINKSGFPLPKYMTEGAAAMDLVAAEAVTIQPNECKIVGTGLFVAIPDGYEIQVRSRSGLAAKNNVFVLNTPGTIDSDYRGEIKVILYNLGVKNFDIVPGDRIAQALLSVVPLILWHEVTELPTTARGLGGFGSTGV
jgi:dUTP pyrophosphatase